jgi:hypothetical protein
MSRESIEALMDIWMNDHAFRVAVRQDPEAAVRGTSLELDEAEWAARRRIDWNQSDQELLARSSKWGTGGCK